MYQVLVLLLCVVAEVIEVVVSLGVEAVAEDVVHHHMHQEDEVEVVVHTEVVTMAMHHTRHLCGVCMLVVCSGATAADVVCCSSRKRVSCFVLC
jgi:hypothetical protein